jgi:hypothetical protein
MVVVAQLVRASDCGSEGRGFESHLPPKREKHRYGAFLFWVGRFAPYLPLLLMVPLGNKSIAEALHSRFAPISDDFRVAFLVLS